MNLPILHKKASGGTNKASSGGKEKQVQTEDPSRTSDALSKQPSPGKTPGTGSGNTTSRKSGSGKASGKAGSNKSSGKNQNAFSFVSSLTSKIGLPGFSKTQTKQQQQQALRPAPVSNTKAAADANANASADASASASASASATTTAENKPVRTTAASSNGPAARNAAQSRNANTKGLNTAVRKPSPVMTALSGIHMPDITEVGFLAGAKNNADAGPKARHELKFLISVEDVPILRQKLSQTLHTDSHVDARGMYHIRSLYFDDIDNSAYHDKMNGVMHRDKYRIRMYDSNSSVLFMERKRKVGDLIIKDSQRITPRLAMQLMDGNPKGLEKLPQPLFRDLFIQMRLYLLKPVVLVDYDREPFVQPVERVRITLDENVRTDVHNLDLFGLGELPLQVLEPGTAILEVKYDNYLPDYIAPLLSSIPATRMAISKYTLCRRFG